MTQEDIIRMAREAEFNKTELAHLGDNFVRFAALVAEAATEAANARANTSWTLMCKKMVAFENEACAKVCEEHGQKRVALEHQYISKQCAAAIRARGQA